jgi:hypothetical protein
MAKETLLILVDLPAQRQAANQNAMGGIAFLTK